MRIGGFEKSTLIDYPEKIACIIYTIGCNFHCPYCHNPELVDETAEEIPLESIIRFLRKRKKMLDGVVITGGEPTMHDDLPKVMYRIKKMGYLIKLDTNGTRPAMIKNLINRKLVDYIAMDIKSPLDKYSQTVGRPVFADAIRQSIKIIMNSPVEYEFRTTVVKSLLSPEDIIGIVKEIKGASRYYLQKFNDRKILNQQFKNKLNYNDDEFKNFKKKIQKYVKICEIR